MRINVSKGADDSDNEDGVCCHNRDNLLLFPATTPILCLIYRVPSSKVSASFSAKEDSPWIALLQSVIHLDYPLLEYYHPDYHHHQRHPSIHTHIHT
jgi:hypothetical protein